MPVRVKTRMSIGTANFYLTEYDPGEPGRLIEGDGRRADVPGDTVPAADDAAAP